MSRTLRSMSVLFRWCLCLLVVLVVAACAGGSTEDTESPEELEARALEIHQRVVTLDTHKDISSNFTPTDGSEGEDPGVNGGRQVDLLTMREGGLDVVFFVVYVGQPRAEGGGLDEEGYEQALEAAMAKFDGIHRMTDEVYPDQIGLAGDPDDVERLLAEGKLVAAIGIENGWPMGEDLSLIERFAELGAGYMSITHNGHNQLGDSQSAGWYATDDEPDRALHGGLSELGRQAVAEMNKWGIMVDISHAGRQTMLDVVEVSQAPVIASHSGVHAIQPVGRNLDDEQLLALRDNGGVVQLVALGGFVRDTSERNEAIAALREDVGLPGGRGFGGRGGRGGRGAAEMTDERRAELEAAQAEFDARMPEIDGRFPPVNVQDFVDHIDYAVNLIGIDHVAISSDFDGGGGIEGWDNAAETFNVTRELVVRGYTEEQIAQIWSGNTLRVWREVEEVGQRLRAEGGS